MSSNPALDKFNQALEIYKSKYKLEIASLLKFIRDKIDSNEEVIARIQNTILKYQNKNDKINEEQLKRYFHLVAAAQANYEIDDMELEQMEKFCKLRFKSKKNKESKKEQKPANQTPKDKEQTSPKQSKANKEKEANKLQQPESPVIQATRYSSNNTTPKKEQTPVEQHVFPSPKGNNYSSPKKSNQDASKLKLNTIQQNVVEQDRTSNVIRTPTNSQEFFAKHPEAQMMKIKSSQRQVQIRGYDKFGQNYFNPIIKYRVVYKDKAIYRRYTQFQNLMRYLNKRYQGFILPQLPPKEGLKSNLSYIWGVDEAFLNERQQKLQQMMNSLLNSKFICQDDALINFLTDQEFQVQAGDEAGTLNYLRSLSEIAFNARQLKSYGMAYYNYFKSFKKSDINTKVTDCYKQAESVLSYCLALQSYRVTITANFDRRRQIFDQLQLDQSDRTLTITQFDKLSAQSAAQVRNLDKEMNKYYELKSQESWLGYLIGQKQYQFDTSVEQLKQRLKDIQRRIVKMENNLIESIDNLVVAKNAYLEEIGTMIVNWRRSIHP